jgi:hypothetical protein
MHDYQGLMGDIHDMEIFLSTFDEFAEKDTTYEPGPARPYYQQHLASAMNAFIEDMQQIKAFWRLATESPFPWESRRRRKKATSSKKPTEPPSEQEKDGNGDQVEAEKEEEK